MSVNTGFGARVFGSWMWLAVAAVAGCSSSPPRLEAPSLSPSSVAAQAMAEYDTDHNGSIDGAELDKSPALKAAFAQLDTSGDQKINENEIAARVQAWSSSKLALIPCLCAVTFNGTKLADATVTFVPEKFLGPNIQPALGKTNRDGVATMATEGLERNGVKLSGVYCGFYKVTISKNDGGAETIPDRYNTQTTLGIEVAPDLPALQSAVRFDLTP